MIKDSSSSCIGLCCCRNPLLILSRQLFVRQLRDRKHWDKTHKKGADDWLMMATRIEACTFGALQDQPWAGELQHGEGSCVHSFDDLKRILETMHLRGRGVGSGASDSDVEEIVDCGSRSTKRLRTDARLLCVCFIPMFAIPRLTDEQLARKNQRRVAATAKTDAGGGGGVH